MQRIILIDDEEGIRHIWKQFHDLAEPVFRGQLAMDVANDLQSGLHKISSVEYDAIILDLKFTGQGTNETIDFIGERHVDLPPITVLTGDEDVYTRRKCMLAGAADFWTKRDAQERPDLFFKAIYNRYLSRYATQESPS